MGQSNVFEVSLTADETISEKLQLISDRSGNPNPVTSILAIESPIELCEGDRLTMYMEET